MAQDMLLVRSVSPLPSRVSVGFLGLVLVWSMQLSPSVMLWKFTGTEAIPNTQQVYLPPLLRHKIDHQAGPELFLPLASVMEDDCGSIGLFWFFIPSCLFPCCGNSGKVPESFCSIYSHEMSALYYLYLT